MARAMQLLAPGPRLRRGFAEAALKEADHWWLGNLTDFRAVVNAATAPEHWEALRDAHWRRRARVRRAAMPRTGRGRDVAIVRGGDEDIRSRPA